MSQQKAFSLKPIIRKPANKHGLVSVAIRYTYDRIPYPFPIGEMILETDWDVQNDKPKSKATNRKQVEDAIVRVMFQLTVIANDIVHSGLEPMVPRVKEQFYQMHPTVAKSSVQSANLEMQSTGTEENSIINEQVAKTSTIGTNHGVKLVPKKDFKWWLNDWLKFISVPAFELNNHPNDGVEETNRKTLVANQLKSFVNRLLEFSKKTDTPLLFEDMDDQFLKKFEYWLVKEKQAKDNYIGFNVKKLKAFLKYVSKQDKTVYVHQHWHDWKIRKEKKTKVSLTPQEIDLIWEYTPKNPYMKLYCDLCVFQCLVGLRRIDAYQPSFTIENGILTGTCIKNSKGGFGGVYAIPLSLDSRILQILKKYDNNLRRIAEQNYNSNIKRILKEMYDQREEIPAYATFGRLIKIEKYQLGIKQSKTQPLYELVSTHTNRRSFVTNCYRRGIKPEDILEMMGSASLLDLLRYLEIKKSDVVQRIDAMVGQEQLRLNSKTKKEEEIDKLKRENEELRRKLEAYNSLPN